MTIRLTASLALVALAGDVAMAQPVAPARPTYSSYSSIIRPGGGGSYYGFGFNQTDPAAAVQNQLLAQQLNQTSRAINGITTFLQTGVDPNLGITGRGAVFNSLGHWYPNARTGGGAGGGGRAMSAPLIGSGAFRNSGAMPGGLGGFGMPSNPTGGTGGAGAKSPATGGAAKP